MTTANARRHRWSCMRAPRRSRRNCCLAAARVVASSACDAEHHTVSARPLVCLGVGPLVCRRRAGDAGASCPLVPLQPGSYFPICKGVSDVGGFAKLIDGFCRCRFEMSATCHFFEKTFAHRVWPNFSIFGINLHR